MKLSIPTASRIRQWRFFHNEWRESMSINFFEMKYKNIINLENAHGITRHRYIPFKLIVICNINEINSLRHSWLNYCVYTKVIRLIRLIRVIVNAKWIHKCIDQKNSKILETTIEFSSLYGYFLRSRSLSKEST